MLAAPAKGKRLKLGELRNSRRRARRLPLRYAPPRDRPVHRSDRSGRHQATCWPKVTELGEWRNVNAHTPQEPALSPRGTLMNKHGGLDAAVPIPLQLGLSATLGRLAEALGNRGVYDRYVS